MICSRSGGRSCIAREVQPEVRRAPSPAARHVGRAHAGLLASTREPGRDDPGWTGSPAILSSGGRSLSSRAHSGVRGDMISASSHAPRGAVRGGPMAVDERVGTRTAELQAERERLVARGIATSPIFVERAHGARMVDVDGREYIDFVGGIGTLNGGHTPEHVVARDPGAGGAIPAPVLLDRAVRAATSRSAGGSSPVHPARGPYKALLVNSGAEATRTRSRSPATPPAARRSCASRTPSTAARCWRMTPHLEGDAVQEGLRPVRARGLPRAGAVPVPRHRHRRGAGVGRAAVQEPGRSVRRGRR